MSSLELVALLGLTAAGFALLVRAAPVWTTARLRAKPLSCAVCMALWSCLGAWLLARGNGAEIPLLAVPAAVPIVAVVYRMVFPPEITLPELPGGEEPGA